MTWDEMQASVRSAEFTMKLVDRHVADMAGLIAGRLRSARNCVSASDLRTLKRELQDFDARTGEWK